MRITTVLALTAVTLLVGCVQASGGSVPSSAPRTSSPTSIVTRLVQPAGAGEVTPVSLTSSDVETAGAIKGCGVLEYRNQVAGIGILSDSRLLPHYVAFTGREPEIQFGGPVFVVRYSGTIRLPTMGRIGAAAYIDADDMTCAMINGSPRWFLTGTWVDADGKRGVPEPVAGMDRQLPALLP